MSFQDPKPGRNRRKYKHGHRHYVKSLLKSRGGEKYSEQRATRQAGRLQLHQRVARVDVLPGHEPMRPRWGDLERQSFRMAPLRAWLRKRVGQPWAVVQADLTQLLNPGSRTGYAAYRELRYWIIWDENEDGPVVNNSFFHSPFYVDREEGCLQMKK
ncbi:hypothetical protein [Neolewinella persica]|uniref:hypothetical protein n=1 Tax=Neolewinella persica TaxID=70998 RepID=UPI000372D810|nr:hypothetical protein [Neolewinella persica]